MFFLATAGMIVCFFEIMATRYYGLPLFDNYLIIPLYFFPSNLTLGECLLVLRSGMPLILQVALMMDNSFDLIKKPEPAASTKDPTTILSEICDS